MFAMQRLVWGIVTDKRLHEAGTPPAALSRDRDRLQAGPFEGHSIYQEA